MNPTASLPHGAADLAADFRQILLVEDNEDYARMVQATLSRSRDPGFRVDHASRLDSGLARLESHRYDAMLLDLTLPDGRGALTVGSACSLAGELPVLVLTGSEDSDLAQASLRAGAQEYLVKHRIDREELPATILRSIDRQRRREKLLPLPRSGQLLRHRIADTLDATDPRVQTAAVLVVRYDNFEVLRCLFGTRICAEMHRSAQLLVGEHATEGSCAPVGSGCFAVLVEGVRSQADVARVSAALLRRLSDMQMRDDAGLEICGITASVGVAVYPWDGVDAEELISNARRAQVVAARAGGSRYRFYREGRCS